MDITEHMASRKGCMEGGSQQESELAFLDPES